MFSEFDKSLFVREKLNILVSNMNIMRDVWRFRCPICGDSSRNSHKKRGNYYLGTNSYYCFNCAYSGSGFHLVAKISGRTYSDVQSEFLCSLRDMSTTTAAPIINEQPDYSSLTPVTATISEKHHIPSNWLTPEDEVKQLIEDRQLYSAPFLQRNFKLYYDENQNKLVIPWMREGQFKCAQYRKLDNSNGPKYIFEKNAPKDVMNLDIVDESLDFIFLVEGVFDAIFVRNGVAVGGLNVSRKQLDLIEEKSTAKVVYMPDNQHTDRASKEFSEKLIDKGKLVFIWPKSITQKDVNSYVTETGNTDFEDFDWLVKHISRGPVAKLKLKGIR
jgi:hypothetical protein